MLKSIKIRNFKRVQDEVDDITKEVIKEKPLFLDNLSGVNYLVGGNSSGKSSVLEALHFHWLVSNSYKEVNFTSIPEEYIKLSCPQNSKTPEQATEVIKLLRDTFSLSSKKQEVELVLYNNFNDVFKFEIRVDVPDQKLVDEKTFNIPWVKSYFNLDNLDNAPMIINQIEEVILINNSISWLNKDMAEFVEKKNPFFKIHSFKKDGHKIKYLDEITPNKRSQMNQILLSYFRVVLRQYSTGWYEQNSRILNYLDHQGQKINSVTIRNKLLEKYDLPDLNEMQENEERFHTGIETYASGVVALFEIINTSCISYTNYENKIVLIEEPEVNLHPKWQKLIPEILKDLSKELNIQFIISTHSNYLISAALEQNQEFGQDLNRVYLLEDGQNTQPDGEPINFSHFDNALSNLGVQPSDLLFANGVIWVEGPSDAIYIEKWLEMYAKSKNQKIYKPGLDFQFQMYGGQLLEYMYYGEEAVLEKIVNLFYINRNFYLITDNDYNTEAGTSNSQFESAKAYFKDKIELLKTENSKVGIWVEENTNISTIEFYLKKGTKYCEFVNKKGGKSKVYSPKANKLLNSTYKSAKGIYSKKVIQNWEKISTEYFEPELLTKIEALYNTIKSWNQN